MTDSELTFPPHFHELINIRLSPATGLRIPQTPSFPEEVHARNKSNFHLSLTIRKR